MAAFFIYSCLFGRPKTHCSINTEDIRFIDEQPPGNETASARLILAHTGSFFLPAVWYKGKREAHLSFTEIRRICQFEN